MFVWAINVHVCLGDQRSCLFERSTFMFVWAINVHVCLGDQRSCLFGQSTFTFICPMHGNKYFARHF